MKIRRRRFMPSRFAGRSLLLAAAMAVALLLSAATESIPQLPQDSDLPPAVETPLAGSTMAAPVNGISEPGASGTRLGFKALDAHGNSPGSSGATAKNGAAAPSGSSWSELQNDSGNTTVGRSQRIGRDFTVPSGQSWTPSGIDVYASMTGSAATTSPFTSAMPQCYRRSPPICGNTATSMLTSSAVAGA